MPFHSRPSSPSKGKITKSRHAGHDEGPDVSTGMLHAAQLLGSIGVPSTSNPQPKTEEARTTASHNINTEIPKRKPVQSSAIGHPPQHQPQLQPPNHPPYPETPDSPVGGAKLPLLYSHSRTLPSHTERVLPGVNRSARFPEELHLPTPPSIMSDVHQYQRSNPYMSNDPLNIQVQQATPQHADGSALPGSLQPGQYGRPGPPSANTTPGSIPTLPQISTQLQESTTPARPMMQNHSHSYSRSSPAGLDQPKYKPFSTTPSASQFSSPNPGYLPQTPQTSAYSPLGLEDVRAQGLSGFGDGPASPSVYPFNGELQFPTTSNYVAPWPIYALDWCKWPLRSHGSGQGKIAIGSYLEDNHNYIQILDAQRTRADPDDPQGESGLEFVKTAEATHAYPVTRVLWEPQSSGKQTIDLLATSGDHLRLWSLPADSQQQYSSNSINRRQDQALQKLSPLALLSNSKSPEHTAPITSLDWNTVSPSLIITSSIDTTCTIWDIPTLTAKTQLIAHDKEVFDVRFCAQSVDVFVSCGADGSVRMFDLRSLEHSTIIYEPSDKNDKSLPSPGNLSPSTPSQQQSQSQQSLGSPPPLLRIAASPHDSHLLATFSQDSSVIRVLDVRQPGQALLELKGHGAPVNSIEWSPNHRGLLGSGGDDSLVLVWDLMGPAGTVGSSTNSSATASVPAGTATAATGAAQGGSGGQGTGQERGPTASWLSEFEVSNLSWSPSNEHLGVCGGRGFWGLQV
ncbi:MAG: hypothetical protein Q9160_002595 [Pyrenula sp. 1 TL-2023]